MRWSALFDDLEAQVSALDAEGRSAEVADRVRAETADLGVADRLRAASGVVRIRTSDGSAVRGTVRSVGDRWLLLEGEAGDEIVVLLDAVVAVTGAGRWARPADGPVQRRLGVRTVLRGLARDRATVHIGLVDGSALVATIDRVGADFIDVAVHAGDDARRTGGVSEMAIVATSAIAVIRRRL